MNDSPNKIVNDDIYLNLQMILNILPSMIAIQIIVSDNLRFPNLWDSLKLLLLMTVLKITVSSNIDFLTNK